MIKKKIKKLAFNKESILCLDPVDLHGVAGGATNASCPTCVAKCSAINQCSTTCNC